MMPLGEKVVPLMSNANDPLLRQELYRALFSGMSAGYMSLLFADAEHPDFWPIFNGAYNFWFPNPDDSYYATPLDDKGSYKISGYRGSVRILDFEVASGDLLPRGTGTLGKVLANYDAQALHVGKDGSFEVVLSAERPVGWKGDWWQLGEGASYMLVRQISYDWLHEVDGRIAIERLDRPAIKPRPSAAQIEAGLRGVAEFSYEWNKLGMDWMKTFPTRGLVNKVTVRSLTDVGGISTQKYIEGMFDLQPDEALIYETEVPKKCRYWNIEITDMLWGNTDYVNRQSSLNGYSAKLDRDGKFRAVIAASDPGVPNWLDTAGYTQGTMMGRWKECEGNPNPQVIKVKLVDVRKYLPADTPLVTADARDASLRLRRKGAQLRRRW